MADERPESEPTPEPAPATEPTPEPLAAAAEPEPEATVESLQADLEEERHARKMYEETLATLSASRSPAPQQASQAPQGYSNDPVVQGIGLSRADIDRIKQEAGLSSDEEVGAAVRWARPIMEALARPLVGYVAALADIADRHEARISIEGYQELADEVEQEVTKMRARGSHLPRTELAQIARAKKLPAILKRETERKKEDKLAAGAARRAVALDDVSTTKVGPSAGGRAPTSLEQIKGLSSRDARIKALEEAAGNRTF